MDGIPVSTTYNFSHTFTTVGTHYVALKTDYGVCFDMESETIYVSQSLKASIFKQHKLNPISLVVQRFFSAPWAIHIAFWLWACALLPHSRLCGQTTYNHYTTASGLPSNEVYSVLQDSLGYLWFGTDHGLVRYNGYAFETFTTADGLTDNTVFNIKQDSKGNVWFLTFNGGLCYFDGQRFRAHKHNEELKKLFAKRLPTSWEIEGPEEHWLGFIDMGIYCFTEKGSTKYLPSPAQITANQGIYLIPVGGGPPVYTAFTGSVDNVSVKRESSKGTYWPLNSSEVVSHNFYLLPTSESSIIVASLNNIVLLQNGQREMLMQWPVQTRITGIVPMADGTLWITAINKGAYEIELCGTQLLIVDSIRLTNSPTGLYLDRQNNTWITSHDKGIYMLPNKNIRVVANNHSVIEPVFSLLVANGNLYAGLPHNGYMVVDSQMVGTVKHRNNSSGPTGSMIIYHDSLLTNIDLRQMMDKSDKVNVDITYFTELMAIDSVTLLVGGSSGIRLIRQDQVVFRSDSLGVNFRVTRMCRLNNDLIVIGTHQGLYYFDITKGSIWPEPALEDVRVASCHKFGNNSYAVATRGKGVAVFVNGKPYFINEQNGLVSNLTEDVYCQGDTLLWVATYKGLSKVQVSLSNNNMDIIDAKHYHKEDGLCSDEINAITGYGNYICLATNAGLCYFEPANLIDDTCHIPFYFLDIEVNGESLPMHNIELAPDQNNLVVRFNALYYKRQANLRYIASLNGGKWQAVNQNEIRYFNLPPGQYTLQIGAEDKFGKYRSQVSTLNFSIAPRFVDTWYFKTIMWLGLAIILLTISLAYIRYQRLRVQNQVRYLQAELKMLSYQINPHFIFNTLNSIQHYMLEKNNRYAVELLGSFSSLIRKVIFNSRKPYISVLEEVECLKEYMDLEKARLDGQFEYEINIDSSVNVFRNSLLPMVVQPVVENAIWHGIIPMLQKGKIIITFKNANGQILCIVEDDGIGVNSKKQRKKKGSSLSIALDNIKERLKIIGELNHSIASITVNDRSSLGDEKGTIVTILFPLIKHVDETD